MKIWIPNCLVAEDNFAIHNRRSLAIAAAEVKADAVAVE